MEQESRRIGCEMSAMAVATTMAVASEERNVMT